ncbi:MAG: oligosaccharide repeat unit polymerase [Polaromonas sp.]|nr:oligosaccharide repeat unit polymerase [Polaromonas sp.]
MIEFFIYSIYVILSFATAIVVRKINYNRLSFADGLLVSVVFFISIPLALILYSGSFNAPDMLASAYTPLLNIATTLNLFLGWIFVLLFNLFWRFRATRNPVRHVNRQVTAGRVLFDFKILIGLYLVLTVTTFFVSGKASAGHWMTKSSDAFQSSTFLILTANIANAYRAIIFGFLAYLSSMRILTKWQCLLSGFAIVIFDIAMTFNRITAAYFFIMIIIINRKHIRLITLALIPILPIVMFISGLWTSIRGLALNNGYSLNGFIDAIKLSLENPLTSGGATGTVALNSNGIFETSNLQVFNYIVEKVPNQEQILWGWTLFLRPLTVFIPSTIWHDKPITYGVVIGRHIQHVEVTLNSTLFGEAYGNFYVFWPLALILILSIAAWLFERLENKTPYIGYMAFFIAFALGRFEINFFVIALLAIVIHMQFSKLLISLRIINKRKLRFTN